MSQNPPPLTRKLLLPLYLIGLGFCVDLSQALKVPFSVKDVLPVLPRQVSWLVFNSFHNAVNLLLVFIGSVIPSKASLEWKGGCFHGNEARLEITGSNRDDLGLGGGVLHLKTSKAHSLTRMDLYVFATPYRITWDYYFSAQDHTLNFDSWEETAVLKYVK